MSTIAKMVIEATVDPRGVKRGLADVVNVMEKMQRVAKNRIKLELQFPDLNLAKVAQEELTRLENVFRHTMADLRDEAGRLNLDTPAWKAAGVQAARDFNAGLSKTIDQLRAANLLTPEIETALKNQYKKLGFDSGTALSQGTQRGLVAHPLLGNLTTQGQRAANSLLNGLNAVFKSRQNELKEQLVNKQITIGQYRKRGLQAAQEFDKGLAAGLADLRAKGQATNNITEALISSFKLAGLKSANAFSFSLDKQLGERTTRVGTTLSQFLTAPIVAAGGAAVKLGADFELSMNRIQAILQPTTKEFEALREQARKLGAESQFSAKDAAEAQAKLAQQGLKTNEILASMPVILNVAAASMTSMTEAADAATTIMFGFGIAADKIGPAMDTIVKLTLTSKSNLQDLSDAFRVVGPSAKAAGQDFETVAAGIGALSKAGLRGQMGGTALRGVLQRIISPTKQAKIALQQLGIQAIDPTTKRMKDLIDIVGQFQRAQKRFKPDQFQDAFGNIFRDRAGTAMNVLMRTGAEELKNLRTQLEQAGGTAKRVGDVQMSGFTGAIRELRSALEELGQAISDSGILRDLTGFARGAAAFLLQLSKTNPEILQMATYTLAVVAALGPMLFLLGKIITTIANLRSIIALLNGPAVLAGLASLVSVGAPLLVGLAALAGLFLLLARNAKIAQEQMEAMRNVDESLNSMTRDQLTAMRKQTVDEITANRELLKTLIAADKKRRSGLKGMFKAPDEKIANMRDLIQFQLDALDKIDFAMRRIDGTAKSTGDTLATTADDLGDFTGGFDDLLGAADKIKTPLELIADKVGTLATLTKIWGSSLRDHQDLVQELLIAYAQVNDLISKQPNLLSKDAAQLLQMKNDLEEIFGSVEFKFAEIPGKDLARQLGIDKPLPLQIRPMIITTSGPEPRSLIDKAMDDFKKAAERAGGDKISIDLFKDVGLKVPVDLLQDYNNQVKIANGLEKTLVTIVQASNLSYDDKEKILKDINEQLAKYQDKSEKAEKSSFNLVTSLEGMANAVRGILHVADAIGHISQESKDALTAVADLVDSIGGLVKSIGTGDVFGAITNAIGTIGSLIQLGSTLFGESPDDKARKQIVKDNTAALGELARSINNFQVNVDKIRSVKPVTDAVVEMIKKLTNNANFQKAFGKNAFDKIEFKSVEDLDAKLRAVGSSFEELQAIAKDLGINLFNEKGRLSAAGLEALGKALELQTQKLTQFGKAVDDQRDRLELRRNVFNLDTTGFGQIQDAFTLLNQFAPGIAAMFQGFDATTKEGRASIEKALQNLFTMLENNLLSPEMFGELDISSLGDIIKQVADALDTFRDSTESANKQMVNVPAGIKIERFRFEALASDMGDSLKKIVAATDPGTDQLKPLKDALGAIGIDVNKTIPKFKPLQDALESGAGIQVQANDELSNFVAALQAAVVATNGLSKIASTTSKTPVATTVLADRSAQQAQAQAVDQLGAFVNAIQAAVTATAKLTDIATAVSQVPVPTPTALSDRPVQLAQAATVDQLNSFTTALQSAVAATSSLADIATTIAEAPIPTTALADRATQLAQAQAVDQLGGFVTALQKAVAATDSLSAMVAAVSGAPIPVTLAPDRAAQLAQAQAVDQLDSFITALQKAAVATNSLSDIATAVSKAPATTTTALADKAVLTAQAVAVDQLGSFVTALQSATIATQSLSKTAETISKTPVTTTEAQKVITLAPAGPVDITGGGNFTLIIQANVQQTSDPEEWYEGVKQVTKDKVRAKYGATAVTRVEENMP